MASTASVASALTHGMPLPSTDPVALWTFGVHGIPMPQYLRWADELDLFVTMADRGDIDRDEIVARTELSDRGAEALLGVLCALGLAVRRDRTYRLAEVASDFLDRRKMFYLGPSLWATLHAPVPAQLRKGDEVRRYSRFTGTLRDSWRYLRRPNQFGRCEQLSAQHRRNLPVNWVAARSPHFAGIRHLVDIGGGSGAFAIPLVVEHPELRVTLVDLPRGRRHIEKFLEVHSVRDRVELCGFNAHVTPWPVGDCDAVLFGNILHFCDDEECLVMLRESRRILPRGRRLFVHEMLWNDDCNGPLLTALWNFWMHTISAGRHRTRGEMRDLFVHSGFELRAIDPTAGGFTLLVGAAV
jgi:ubiquinone/menaquinone biosynthesis C-methylase UbiE